jgi:hypothetical protein
VRYSLQELAARANAATSGSVARSSSLRMGTQAPATNLPVVFVIIRVPTHVTGPTHIPVRVTSPAHAHRKVGAAVILRRRSGFAYSFVAILRAEPRHTAASILPRVLAILLRLASQDTDAMAATAQEGGPSTHLVWRLRIHALNTLKLISQDAVLADDVAVYVSQMLELAIFRFKCCSWVVRNSFMMLIPASTQRALGDKRIDDGASQNKIPSAEVFSRFPQLARFLYYARNRFMHAVTTQGVVPPGQFPVLMFLSRLRPTECDAFASITRFGPSALFCHCDITVIVPCNYRDYCTGGRIYVITFF